MDDQPLQPEQSGPPGWYQNEHGQLQWWDGYAWDALQPPPAPVKRRTNGLAVASIIFAVLSLITTPATIFAGLWGEIFLVGLIPFALGVTFGWTGIYRGKRTGAGEKLAVIGLIITVLPVPLSFFGML